MSNNNILIIEDDNYLNKEISFHLEIFGNYKVDIFDNVDECLSNMNNLNKYKLITIDLMMPKGDLHPEQSDKNLDSGELLFRLIKKKYPNKDIIIITAKKEKEINLTQSELFNIPIFYKPLVTEDLNNFLTVVDQKFNLK